MTPSDLFTRIDPKSPLRRVTFLGAVWEIRLSDYAGLALLAAAVVLAGVAVALR